ncbi:hypothetical protein HDU87_006796 [Geranomyces variabilis]|uniref:Protein kinase domain-containing protein n=1 Tax=Geranomyces variabilis TaxID=109894 RepID=A0AAD5TRX9_9FUNG|nr:hypothetical protein HDU87_006796 [Geranomyces variabilis]
MITTLSSWWFLERPDHAINEVRIAGPFPTTGTNPTIAQCLDYMLALALAKPELASPSESAASTPAGSPLSASRKKLRIGGGSSGLGGPSGGTSTPPTGGFKKYAASRGRKAGLLDLPARLIDQDGGFEEFTEANMLPGLRKSRVTSSSTVAQMTVSIPPNKSVTLALKIIDRTKVAEEICTQLETEIDAYSYLVELQGTIIPALRAYGCFQGGQFPLIGTEYIEGHELSANDQEHFPAVRNAIRRLHDAGIIHGDLARRNILITESNERRVVIIDLGLAEEATTDAIAEETGHLVELLTSLSA